MTLSTDSPGSHHYLPNIWQGLVKPLHPLLADECGLSIIASQYATPILLEAIYYQLLKLSYTDTLLDKLLAQHFTKPILAESSINFTYIATTRPKILPLHEAFFSHSASFWAFIGMTCARTHISPHKLANLMHWLTFIVLKSIVQVQNLTNVSPTTLMNWLPYSLPRNRQLDKILLEIILLDSPLKTIPFLQPVSNQNSHPENSKVHMLIMQTYQNMYPYEIVSSYPNKNTLKQTSIATNDTLSIKKDLKIPKSSVDIFATSKPTKTSLHHMLQRHWIAFTVGLSTLVIGGVGAISAIHKPTASNEINSITKTQDIPHDVAIVRTNSSELSPTTNQVKKSVSSKINNLKKPANLSKKPIKSPLPNNQKIEKSHTKDSKDKPQQYKATATSSKKPNPSKTQPPKKVIANKNSTKSAEED